MIYASYFSMVRDFHRAFGHVIRDEPINFNHEDISPDDQDLLDLREELHREEWNELQDAWNEEDLIEIADAIADLIYVLCGTAVSLGLPLDDIFEEVHQSNMSKLMPDGSVRYREDGKVLPSPNFYKPNLRKVIYGES